MTNRLQSAVDDMFAPTSPSDTENEEDIGFVMLDGDRLDPHVVRKIACRLHELVAAALEADADMTGDEFDPRGLAGMPTIGQIVRLCRVLALVDEDDDPTERNGGALAVLHWVLGRGRSQPFDEMIAQAIAVEEALAS